MANSWSRIKFTEEGGLATWMINQTTAASIRGLMVQASTGTDNAVARTTAASDHPIGAMETSGTTVGASLWIVHAGRAAVLADAGGFALQDRMITSATPGAVDVNNTPAAAVHFREVGHAISTAAANGVGYVQMHFL